MAGVCGGAKNVNAFPFWNHLFGVVDDAVSAFRIIATCYYIQ